MTKDVTDITNAAEVIWVMHLVKMVSAQLAGEAPETQGAVLADLAAMWLAGHPEASREAILKLHVGAIRRLVPVNLAKQREALEKARPSKSTGTGTGAKK